MKYQNSFEIDYSQSESKPEVDELLCLQIATLFSVIIVCF